MDYKRIYAEFIKDRREKEKGLSGYVERHHILPRAMGGGNEPENLIRLTPEDHYFAHLCLAKIHGGKMWAAVYAMCHLVNKSMAVSRRKLAARIQFGHVRRSLSNYYRSILSGQDGRLADQTPHILHSFDGRVAVGRRFELEVITGVSRSGISGLLRGAKMSARGWYCPKHNPEGLTPSVRLSRAHRSKELHTLYHHDGRVWSGLRVEFRKMTGLRLDWQSAEHRSIAGWYRNKSDAARHTELLYEKARKVSSARGDISGEKNPMFGTDRRKDMAVNLVHKNGKRFSGSLKVLADDIGISVHQYGQFRKIILGVKIVKGCQVKSFHGWKNEEAANALKAGH